MTSSLHLSATSTISSSTCAYRARFGSSLPADFARRTAQMSWKELITTYSVTTGRLYLADFSSHYQGRGLFTFTARITRQATTTSHTISATGPFSALTHLLAELGCSTEVSTFTQHHCGDEYATIIEAHAAGKNCWALGIGRDSTSSIASALLSAANQLHS